MSPLAWNHQSHPRAQQASLFQPRPARRPHGRLRGRDGRPGREGDQRHSAVVTVICHNLSSKNRQVVQHVLVYIFPFHGIVSCVISLHQGGLGHGRALYEVLQGLAALHQVLYTYSVSSQLGGSADTYISADSTNG